MSFADRQAAPSSASGRVRPQAVSQYDMSQCFAARIEATVNDLLLHMPKLTSLVEEW